MQVYGIERGAAGRTQGAGQAACEYGRSKGSALLWGCGKEDEAASANDGSMSLNKNVGTAGHYCSLSGCVCNYGLVDSVSVAC